MRFSVPFMHAKKSIQFQTSDQVNVNVHTTHDNGLTHPSKPLSCQSCWEFSSLDVLGLSVRVCPRWAVCGPLYFSSCWAAVKEQTGGRPWTGSDMPKHGYQVQSSTFTQHSFFDDDHHTRTKVVDTIENNTFLCCIKDTIDLLQ